MSRSSFLPPPETERRIAWVLAHPGFSDWLKVALMKALDRNPIDVANDLELLGQLLRPWTSARIDQLLDISEKAPPKV